MNKRIFEIKGFGELTAKIKKLPDKAKRKEVLKILRKSARSTVKEARNQAPKSKKTHVLKGGKKVDPGNTRKSIGIQVARRARNPMIVVRPKSSGRYDGFYARAFVIFGHNIYRVGFKRNRRGNSRFNSKGATGRIPANKFMNRAKDKTEGKVSREALVSTEKYIQKLIDRL
ncbi:hypothetical protein [Aquimarina sp. 2201CG14-23]|uniref:hypothetical protein n=1 Tax=Aquimarina mycalae TaxID=3040073 RepID=UPI002478215F|nr:hypothetical protein [Aquimarina sp. 2201CG14-23]MDH7444675.1 hypothetical protein [Aquimarina sp. 2201CG14-23]